MPPTSSRPLLAVIALTLALIAPSPTLPPTHAAPPEGSVTITNPCGSVILPKTVCEQGTITSPATDEKITLTAAPGTRTPRLTVPTPITGVARRDSKVFVHILLSDRLTPAQAVPTQTIANAAGTFTARVAFPVPLQAGATSTDYYIAAFYLRATTEIENDASFFQITGAPSLKLGVTVPPPPSYSKCEDTYKMEEMFEAGLPGTFGVNLHDDNPRQRRTPTPPATEGELFVFTLTEVTDPTTANCGPCEWKRDDDEGEEIISYYCVERPSGFDPLIFLSSDTPVTARINATPSRGTLLHWNGPVVDGAWEVDVDPMSSRQPLSYVFSLQPLGPPAETGWSIPSDQLLPFTQRLLLGLGYPADEVQAFIDHEVAPYRLTSPALELSFLSPTEAASIVELNVSPRPARTERLILRVAPTSELRVLPPPDVAPFQHQVVPGLSVREYGIF